MDKIIIKNLQARGIIGIDPDERVNKQNIIVNVVMFADTRAAARSDDIADAVNYGTISKRILKRIETGEDLLVERLVEDLARMIVVENTAVSRVIVRVEKSDVLPFTDTVGVEIERGREDFE